MRAVGVMDFAGGFAKGVTQAGFDYVAKREPSAFAGFGVTAVETNFQGVQIEVTEPELWSMVKADLIFGCPPCSGFSMLSAANTADSKTGRILEDGTRVAQRGVDSPDNDWMYSLVDYSARVKPQVVVFESVRSGGTLGQPLMRELWQRLRDATGIDYHMTDVFMNAALVGGDAIRSRYFFVAHTRPFGVDLPHAEPRTLMEVIGDLGPAHGTRMDPGVDIAWGHVTNASKTYERIRDTIEMFRTEGYDWAEGKRLPEHFEVWLKTHDDYPDYWYNSNGTVQSHARSDNMFSPFRWRANKPMGVVTGGFMERAVHPIEARTFTYREGARLMGFPDDWSLYPLISGRHDSWLGKAIPVASGRWIGTWARASMEGAPGEYAGELVEEKHRVIDVSNADRVHKIEREGRASVWWPDPVGREKVVFVPEAIGRGGPRPEPVLTADTIEAPRRGRPAGTRPVAVAAAATSRRATPPVEDSPTPSRALGEARPRAERVVATPIERVAPSVVSALIDQLGLSRGEAAEALSCSRSRVAEMTTESKPGSWLNAARWPDVQAKLREYAAAPRTM